MLPRVRKAMADKDQGFTLIELLVVMIIIGILAAIAVPVYLSQQSKARQTAAQSDGNVIGLSVATYFAENTAAPTITQSSTTWTLAAGGTTYDTGSLSKADTITASTLTSGGSFCVVVATTAAGTSDKYAVVNSSGVALSASAGAGPTACTPS